MQPQRFRKRPVEIEAVRLPNLISDTPGAPEMAREIAKWCGGHESVELPNYRYRISIPTLEGTMIASPGDYIIRGVQGEFYPCRADIFEQTYEPVDGGESR